MTKKSEFNTVSIGGFRLDKLPKWKRIALISPDKSTVYISSGLLHRRMLRNVTYHQPGIEGWRIWEGDKMWVNIDLILQNLEEEPTPATREDFRYFEGIKQQVIEMAQKGIREYVKFKPEKERYGNE